MTRPHPFALFALFAVSTCAPGPLGAAASDAACRDAAAGNERREIECRIPPGDAERHVRLVARFAGSHDDTTLRLEASLDGRPEACAAGSKVYSEFEDGDVSLDCRVAIPARGAGPSVLRVKLRWHHAEYTGYELRGD